MVSVYDIKPKFQALLRPISNGLARVGITANQVTLAALALSLAIGAAIYCYRDHPRILLLLPVAMFIRMALNAIDGMLAREHHMASRLGAVLNELSDVISDAVLYLPLAVVPGFNPYLMVPIVLLAIISELAGVVAIQIGSRRRYDGPMGKSDRALVLGTIGFAIGIGAPTGRWLDIVLAVVIALVVLTIIHRCYRALREPTA